MQENFSLVIRDELHAVDYSDVNLNEPVFLLENNKQLYFQGANDEMLRELVYTLTRQPRNLLVHLQRIIICYEKNNEAQLSAALMDLFVVLEKRGGAIKHRMLAGSREHLSAALFEQLQAYIDAPQFIPGNMYTVLTSGWESSNELSLVQDNTSSSKEEYDPLQVARDYIEYSQLEEAVKVLEQAIIDDPQRTELHADLIELYQSTADYNAFNKMQLALEKVNHPMQAQWDALNSYFNQ